MDYSVCKASSHRRWLRAYIRAAECSLVRRTCSGRAQSTAIRHAIKDYCKITQATSRKAGGRGHLAEHAAERQQEYRPRGGPRPVDGRRRRGNRRVRGQHVRVLPLLLRALLLLLQLHRGTQLPLSCQVVHARCLGHECSASTLCCIQYHTPWNPPAGVQTTRFVVAHFGRSRLMSTYTCQKKLESYARQTSDSTRPWVARTAAFCAAAVSLRSHFFS